MAPTVTRITVSQRHILAMGAFFFVLMPFMSLTSRDHFPTLADVRVAFTISACVTPLFLLILAWPAYRWVELDGDVIRARRLLSWRPREWRVSDVQTIDTDAGLLRYRFVRKALAQSNLGREVRFRDGGRLQLVRSHTPGLDDFIAKVRAAMPEGTDGA